MSTARKSSSKVLDTRYCGAPNATLMVVEGFVIPAVAVAPGKFDLGLSVEGMPGYRELDVEAGPSPAAVGRRKKEKSGRIACARPQWEDATILNLSYQADPELNPN